MITTSSSAFSYFSRRPLLATALALVFAANACSSDDDDDATPGRGGASSGGSGASAGTNTGGARGGSDSATGGGAAVGGGGEAGQSGEGGAGAVNAGGAGAGEGGSAGAAEGGGAGAAEGGGAGEAGAVGGGGAGAGGESPNPVTYRPTRVDATEELIASLSVKDGFSVNVFASGLDNARMLASHGGHIYVTQPMMGDVVMLTDANSDGVAEGQITAISGLPNVHGIVFDEDDVYLATVQEVYRAAVDADGTFGATTTLVDDLPNGGQHPYRTLGIGPDGNLYISVGSDCDSCIEPDDEHATLLRMPLSGGERAIFAAGLRNTIGFDWHPVTGALWGMDQGSDQRGNETPPEELNRIQAGRNYGWPFCFGEADIDPITDDPPAGSKAEFCATTVPSVLSYDAHNSPIGFTFYRADQFPASYVNSAFIAFHGSWNRFPPSGYEIVQVLFDGDGNPTGFEDFVTGFLINDGTEEFGRPAGITVDSEGALLFSDDENGYIYRVQYEQQSG